VHPNELVIRDFFAHFGDRATIERVFAPDATWREPGSSPISGRYVGRDAVADLIITSVVEGSGGTFRVVEVVDVLANDRFGLALVTVEATNAGRHIVTTDRVIFELRDGLIIDARVLSEDQAEVDAFWAE
jgi:ketosteroid isomerase-like protein